MSKSLKRVRAALEAAGISTEIREAAGETKTAAQAAAEVGVEVDQIVKSIVYRGESSGDPVLLLTAGGNRVVPEAAARAAGEPLGKADAALIRARTGFAIGGVSPVGHIAPIRAFLDPRLLEFDVVWAAAGTPRHNFAIAPEALMRISGARPAAFAVPGPDRATARCM